METKCEMYDYGILNEESDLRAHVGVLSKRVFVFPTQRGVEAIHKYKDKLLLKTATQIEAWGPTAKGYAIPIDWIEDLKTINLKESWEGWLDWYEYLSTSDKGARAVHLVMDLIKIGKLPLFASGTQCEDVDVQIRGTDIIAYAKKKIQVKCDFRAGPRSVFGCTGNLYLQIAERNPFNRH